MLDGLGWGTIVDNPIRFLHSSLSGTPKLARTGKRLPGLIELDFYCDMHEAGAELTIKIRKPWTHDLYEWFRLVVVV